MDTEATDIAFEIIDAQRGDRSSAKELIRKLVRYLEDDAIPPRHLSQYFIDAFNNILMKGMKADKALYLTLSKAGNPSKIDDITMGQMVIAYMFMMRDGDTREKAVVEIAEEYGYSEDRIKKLFPKAVAPDKAQQYINRNGL